MEIEGHAMNKPPLFKGQNYNYWKQRMMTFFDVCHIDMWDIIENGNYIPTNKEGERFQDLRRMKNKRQEYKKGHSYKLSKEMWNTLALSYEDKTYDNYDHITKIFEKPQVTAVKTSKNLKKLPMEELMGMLKATNMKVHNLKAQKASKGSMSKAYKAEKSYGNTSNISDEDELSFILRKIQSMWKHKKGSRWTNNFKKYTKETKDKTQVVCYECKKPGHFKSECPNLEKEEEKEEKTFIKKKKRLMAT
ncbi:hypothetical protein CR513_00057, partial [Mucuna pruriens]